MPVSGLGPHGGGAQAGVAEAIASENNNLLPDGKSGDGMVTIPAPKKAVVHQATGTVSVGEHQADGEGGKDGAPASGPTPEETPADDVTAEKPEGGLPPAKAPTVKVSVVNKSADAAKASVSDETTGGDGVAGARRPGTRLMSN